MMTPTHCVLTGYITDQREDGANYITSCMGPSIGDWVPSPSGTTPKMHDLICWRFDGESCVELRPAIPAPAWLAPALSDPRKRADLAQYMNPPKVAKISDLSVRPADRASTRYRGDLCMMTTQCHSMPLMQHGSLRTAPHHVRAAFRDHANIVFDDVGGDEKLQALIDQVFEE